MYKTLGNKHFQHIFERLSKPMAPKQFDFKEAQWITKHGQA